MLITTIPDILIQHDKALGLTRIAWTSGQDMRTFRATAAQVLPLARQLGTRHMLLDMNSLPDISVYDQVWLGTSWIPVLLSLPLECLVLAINRRRVHNQLAIDSLIALARPFIKFDIQYFPTAITGVQWLCDYSNRLPALLAEWNDVTVPVLPPPPAEPLASYRPLL